MARLREARYGRLDDVILDLRPILLDLRRRQGAWSYGQAAQLLKDGQLEAAGSAVRKVLDLDPMHPGASALRLEIDQALYRRDVVARAEPLLEKAERELSQRRFEQAAAHLAGVPTSAWSAPELQARFRQAGAQVERMRAAERQLTEARESLRQENLTAALRTASEALAADPGNGAGRGLLQEIRDRIASRDARRRFEEEIARAEGLLLVGRSAEALEVLARLEGVSAGSADVTALRQRAQSQKTREEQAQRLALGMAEVGTLLNRREFHQAIQAVEKLTAEFPGNTELQALREHAEERLAGEMRRQLLEVNLEDAPVTAQRPEAERPGTAAEHPAPRAERPAAAAEHSPSQAQPAGRVAPPADLGKPSVQASFQPAAGRQPAPQKRTTRRAAPMVWIGTAALGLVAAGVVYWSRPHTVPAPAAESHPPIAAPPPADAAKADAAPQPQTEARQEPSAPKNDGDRPSQAPVTNERKQAAAEAAPPPCQAPKFAMDQYGDALAGELVWAGSLVSRGRLSIENRRASLGRVQGDVLPQNVPLRISVSPATVRLAAAPSAANCWAAGLALENVGPEISEIRIRWQVFQP
jgi:tetratricopeptide (TPR) repeat protein